MGRTLSTVETLFDETPATDRATRLLALAALLKAWRGHRRWSVELAAKEAHIGHVTWRRAELGTSSQARTYAAMDELFGVAPGAVLRSTNSDRGLVDLAVHLGMEVTAADLHAPERWVARMAQGIASTTPAGRLAARHQRAESSAAWLPGSDLEVISAAMERLSRLQGELPRRAAHAVAEAMPAVIEQTHPGMRAVVPQGTR